MTNSNPLAGARAPGQKISASNPDCDWQIRVGVGPVVATAIHDGHRIRDSLLPYLAISDSDRRREEDPLTAIFLSAADTTLRLRSSRFEFDVNRPRGKAISSDPADTWGLKIWKDTLPDTEIERSLARHDRFYETAVVLLDSLLEDWGSLLVLDIHSYNHRRDGASAAPANQRDNPDIDLGVTTLDPQRWGDAVRGFEESLGDSRVGGKKLDIRRNVRYPSGGHFPEWIYSRYGKSICTISLEYKKIFMDEWQGQADIAMADELRKNLEDAVASVRMHFGHAS